MATSKVLGSSTVLPPLSQSINNYKKQGLTKFPAAMKAKYIRQLVEKAEEDARKNNKPFDMSATFKKAKQIIKAEIVAAGLQ